MVLGIHLFIFLLSSVVWLFVRVNTMIYAGERGLSVLQQRRDGGVPGAQGGHDAHGKNELMSDHHHQAKPWFRCSIFQHRRCV